MNPIYSIKKILSEAIPPFDILRFDIRPARNAFTLVGEYCRPWLATREFC
jgi:hypothetical protein